MSNTKTIKEIAAECGVSARAVRAWCARNEVGTWSEHGRNMGRNLSEHDISLIYRHYGVEVGTSEHEEVGTSEHRSEHRSEHGNDVPADSKSSKMKQKTIELLAAELETLRDQLKVKDEQIKVLQEQLGQTTSALLSAQESIKAAQLLHAADKKEELLPEATADEDKDKTARKRWWHFWKEDTK